MVTDFNHRHHQIIEDALSNFNSKYLSENNILFGGGTRIALELGEYRESIDIDFLCPDTASYRAVRTQVTNATLGDLVIEDFTYPRDIRADRDAVRCFIEYSGTVIKLEFVAFSDYDLNRVDDLFSVPCIDEQSCFYTKLLANADRHYHYPYKDIIDICAMVHTWGDIPVDAIKLAEQKYGENLIIPSLLKALQFMLDNPDELVKAADEVMMTSDIREALLEEVPQSLIEKYS